MTGDPNATASVMHHFLQSICVMFHNDIVTPFNLKLNITEQKDAPTIKPYNRPALHAWHNNNNNNNNNNYYNNNNTLIL